MELYIEFRFVLLSDMEKYKKGEYINRCENSPKSNSVALYNPTLHFFSVDLISGCVASRLKVLCGPKESTNIYIYKV